MSQPTREQLLDQFDEIANSVWLELGKIIPEEFKPHLMNIRFLILDEPDATLLADLSEDMAEDPQSLCGLHVGTPLTEASILAPDPQPTRVYLFRKALVEMTDPDEDMSLENQLREEIAVTLLHEIGHSFGLEEDDLERLGFD